MSPAWFVAGLGFGLVAGIVLKTALDALEGRAGYTPAPIRIAPLDGADIVRALRRHQRQTGRRNLA